MNPIKRSLLAVALTLTSSVALASVHSVSQSQSDTRHNDSVADSMADAVSAINGAGAGSSIGSGGNGAGAGSSIGSGGNGANPVGGG
ncbi:hypothetical protein [Erwinia sp. 9145]|uniref:hypothetical protein n=1 Tax=Erwinia sp. 9145 TaxID=1500895 RepID=UPI000554F2FC|nr:hypothetical protein [Erwinia sp. 9145]